MKTILLAVLICSTFTLSTNALAIEVQKTSIDDVIVPIVANKSSVTNAPVGTVLYDINNDNFFGLDKSGSWRSLSGSAIGFSEVQAYTGNGHGSNSNNRIRRFSNSTTSGTAITYADNATDGATFTINENGIYSITYFDTTSVAGYIGVSRNAASLTTAIQGLSTASEKLVLTYTAGTNLVTSVSTTIRLAIGDIIRAQTEGTANGGGTSCVFRISKVSN